LPNGTQNHRFDFVEIELADVPAEQLLQLGLSGVLPLSLLAKDGTKPEVVDTVIEMLANEGERDLLAIAYTLGGLVFTTTTAKEWYRRRFHMFEDLIRDNWVYQEITQEGFDKGIKQGIEQGREQGIEQGELRALRETILDIAHERFPEIEALSKRQIESVKTPTVLRRLIVNMSKATDVVEAGTLVLALRDGEAKQ
jgi:predicted transposase YdaD